MKQLSFFPREKLDFGGVCTNGKRKVARPIDTRKPLFLTLKATNDLHFLNNKTFLFEVIKKQSDLVGAKVFSAAIQADHLHLAIQFASVRLYRRWIRAVTGILARKIPGVQWRHRPHSQVVHWGRQFDNVLKYIQYNREEAGLIEWSHLAIEEWRARVWNRMMPMTLEGLKKHRGPRRRLCLRSSDVRRERA